MDSDFCSATFWLVNVFAASGVLLLIIGIVFLSLGIAFERSKRKQLENDLIHAKINRPRPLVLPVPTPASPPPVNLAPQVNNALHASRAPPVTLAPLIMPAPSVVEMPVASNQPTYQNAPPKRPTDLPIIDPYLPKPPPLMLEPVRPPPPTTPVLLQKPLPPYGFTYLPNGVLNENEIRNRDSMFNNPQPAPSEPWNPAPYRAYSNHAYED